METTTEPGGDNRRAVTKEKGYAEFYAIEQENWDYNYTANQNEFMLMAFAAGSVVTATRYLGDEDYTRVTLTDGKAYVVRCGYEDMKKYMT